MYKIPNTLLWRGFSIQGTSPADTGLVIGFYSNSVRYDAPPPARPCFLGNLSGAPSAVQVKHKQLPLRRGAPAGRRACAPLFSWVPGRKTKVPYWSNCNNYPSVKSFAFATSPHKGRQEWGRHYSCGSVQISFGQRKARRSGFVPE